MFKTIIYTIKTIPKHQVTHNGECIGFLFAISTNLLYYCWVCDVVALFYILFTTSSFLLQESYLYFYVFVVYIDSINNFLIMIFWGYNMCCYDDSETSSYTQRWVNWYRHYLWFQRGYWISIDFLLLVDYFISYFCSVQFNLNTYTHNFMLSLFW